MSRRSLRVRLPLGRRFSARDSGRPADTRRNVGSRSQGTLKGVDAELGRGPGYAPPIGLDEPAPEPPRVPSDDGLDGARGLMMGVVLGAALWLVWLAMVLLGRLFPGVRFG
jgi:hypothetical protein